MRLFSGIMVMLVTFAFATVTSAAPNSQDRGLMQQSPSTGGGGFVIDENLAPDIKDPKQLSRFLMCASYFKITTDSLQAKQKPSLAPTIRNINNYMDMSLYLALRTGQNIGLDDDQVGVRYRETYQAMVDLLERLGNQLQPLYDRYNDSCVTLVLNKPYTTD